MPSLEATVLARLPRTAKVTVTVDVADWLAAQDLYNGGPEIVTSAQAAKLLGYDAAYWGRMAKAGKLPGAYRESDEGRWRLPRVECEAHIRRLQRRAPAEDPATRLTLTRSVPRGPRKKASTTRASAS